MTPPRDRQGGDGVRHHLMATGEYNARGSSWTGKSSRNSSSSGAAVVAKGVVKGAKFILRGKGKR